MAENNIKMKKNKAAYYFFFCLNKINQIEKYLENLFLPKSLFDISMSLQLKSPKFIRNNVKLKWKGKFSLLFLKKQSLH